MGADADPVSTPAKKSAGIADLRRSFSAAVGSADSMHVVVGAVVVVVVVAVLVAIRDQILCIWIAEQCATGVGKPYRPKSSSKERLHGRFFYVPSLNPSMRIGSIIV